MKISCSTTTSKATPVEAWLELVSSFNLVFKKLALTSFGTAFFSLPYMVFMVFVVFMVFMLFMVVKDGLSNIAQNIFEIFQLKSTTSSQTNYNTESRFAHLVKKQFSQYNITKEFCKYKKNVMVPIVETLKNPSRK